MLLYRLFKNRLLFQQWQPFQATYELIRYACQFLSVAHTSHVDLYVVFPNQGLWWQINSLDIKTAAVFLSRFGVWPLLRHCFIPKIVLFQSFIAQDRLF